MVAAQPVLSVIKAFQALGSTYFLPRSGATSITVGIEHREDAHGKGNDKLATQKG